MKNHTTKFIALLTFIAVLSLTACAGSGNEGTYSAQTPQDGQGWTDTLSVTYEGGKITAAEFESVHEDGRLKSETTPEEYPMDPHPSVWIDELSENVKNASSSEDVVAIAGATTASNNAKLMLAAIEKNAQEGNTDTAMVETP